jgi:DnaJ-class molecular chaperone
MSFDKEEEKRLYERMIKAKYAYMKYVKKDWTEKCEQDILKKNLRMKDYYRTCLYVKDETLFNLSEDEKKELSIIYKSLCILFHPDKNQNVDTTTIFQIIQKFYKEQNLKELKRLYEESEKTNKEEMINKMNKNINEYKYNDELDDISENDITKMESKTKDWESRVWYLWHTNNATVMYMFETKNDEGCEKNEEWKKENEKR